MAATDVSGTVHPDLAPVRDAFAAEVEQDAAAGGTGSAVAVWHRGAWVVDLWGGWADAAHTSRWQRDTLVMPYSVTKPFTAVAALVLADRGRLDLDAPLASSWPELVAPTTMRQVLSHQSGVTGLEGDAPEEAFYDWDLMCRLVAAQPPQFEPGTACAESALLFGHLVGEVVRRVDGRSLGTFLREEVCGPHGIDFHVGLGDDELARVAELTGFGEQVRADVGGGPLRRMALAQPPGARDPRVVNGERWRRAEVPSVNGHGTARGVAGLYVALQEGRVLSAAMLEELRTVAVDAVDLFVGERVQWGLGVGLDPDGYGMGGVGGSVGWCSTVGDYCFGYVTGTIAAHDRSDRVENALRACLSLPPV